MKQLMNLETFGLHETLFTQMGQERPLAYVRTDVMLKMSLCKTLITLWTRGSFFSGVTSYVTSCVLDEKVLSGVNSISNMTFNMTTEMALEMVV